MKFLRSSSVFLGDFRGAVCEMNANLSKTKLSGLDLCNEKS